MSFETPKELAQPQDIQDTIAYLYRYQNEVNPMGGNDSENNMVRDYIEELQFGKQIAKERLLEIKNAVGMSDDKSSNYH